MPPRICTSAGGFAAGGKGLRQQVLHGCPLGQPLPELGRQGLQLLVAEGLRLFFKTIDLVQMHAGDDGVRLRWVLRADVAHLADITFVAGAQDARQELGNRFGNGGQAVAQLFPKANVQTRFSRHVGLRLRNGPIEFLGRSYQVSLRVLVKGVNMDRGPRPPRSYPLETGQKRREFSPPSPRVATRGLWDAGQDLPDRQK
jgi:hypothetical protein